MRPAQRTLAKYSLGIILTGNDINWALHTATATLARLATPMQLTFVFSLSPFSLSHILPLFTGLCRPRVISGLASIHRIDRDLTESLTETLCQNAV